MFNYTHKELSAGLASAPGDLPMPAIREREASKAKQFRHDNTITPRAPRANQKVCITATSGIMLALKRAEIWYTTDGSMPDTASLACSMTLEHISWSYDAGYLQHWQAYLPAQPDNSIVRYRIAGYHHKSSQTPAVFAQDGSGFWFQMKTQGLSTFAYQVKDKPRSLPAWFKDAVTYHIFLDRFHTGSEDGIFPENLDGQAKHGGTLKGVIKALPYLADLGVTCLWLSPIGPSPSYHRYDQTSFVDVDPELGSVEDMRHLVQTAHMYGMHLILDFVPSHGSQLMPEFQAAQTDQTAPSYDWFVFDKWPESYRCFLDIVPFLVSFNSNSEGLRQFLTNSALFWLQEIGFDGLRLDHVIGHGSDFWVHFSHTLETQKPEVALFGELTDTPDLMTHMQGKLQAVLDFPLAQALRMAMGQGAWSASNLGQFLAAYQEYMPSSLDRVSFIDNHDMNRFLFLAANNHHRLQLALFCLFTLPYPPVLFYGTELGLSQQDDKDATGFGGDHVIRATMPWQKGHWNQALQTYCKALIRIRKEQPTLRQGHWMLLWTHDRSNTMAYALTLEDQNLVVILNLSEKEQKLEQSITARHILFSSNEATHWQDNTLHIAALSGVLLKD